MLETDINKLVKKFKLDPLKIIPTDNYYDHVTFSVRSLSEFILLIERLATLTVTSPNKYFIYRGMSDANWRLIPSLMRKISEAKYGYTLEHDLAVEFSSEMPSLFQNADSNFEKISKMQHFGIPTRLLDFTLNPLIALYFACAERSRTAGRIVFTLDKLHHFDDHCVECVSSLYLYENCNNIKIDNLVRPHNITVSDYLFGAYFQKSPLFVKPPYLDNRMQAQRSVFLLFYNHVRDLLAEKSYYEYKGLAQNLFPLENLETIYEDQIAQPRLRIGEYNCFIVDKCSFQRLTDSYRKAELDNFSEKLNNAFTERFYLQDSISPLEMPDIWFEFSSIIVPPKYKKVILQQLEYIGIDEAYVYPEAEHIAKRIKKRQK